MSASVVTPLLAVMTALLGILTAALETPSTPSSADRTFLTHPTPQVMPVTLSLTVFVSAFSALTSVLLSIIWPAVTAPIGSAAKAQSANAFCVLVIFLFSWFGLKDAFPD